MHAYKDLILDEERALYGITDAEIINCAFEGPADGESALKETRSVRVTDSRFCLRYPLWHAQGLTLKNCEMQATDLAFEYSDVHADVRGHIVSIKNPASGIIRAQSIGQIIRDEHQRSGANCVIETAPVREPVLL